MPRVGLQALVLGRPFRLVRLPLVELDVQKVLVVVLVAHGRIFQNLRHKTRGLSCDHVDGVAATWSHEDAVAAALSRRRHRRDRVLSDTPRRPRRGPKRLKLEKETTHDLV